MRRRVGWRETETVKGTFRTRCGGRRDATTDRFARRSAFIFALLSLRKGGLRNLLHVVASPSLSGRAPPLGQSNARNQHEDGIDCTKCYRKGGWREAIVQGRRARAG
ncbi:unnamed protein product [Musa acuminata var. zebrina]